MTWRRATGIVLGAVLPVLLLCGCGEDTSSSDAAALLAMLQSGNVEAAVEPIKEYVNAYPSDPAGHWMLGRAYAASTSPIYAHITGEFRIALGLERRHGGIGGLEPILSREEFLMTAYEQTAYALVAWVVQARDVEVPVPMVLPRLREARDAVDQALAVNGDAPELLKLRDRIAYYLERYGQLDGGGGLAPGAA